VSSYTGYLLETLITLAAVCGLAVLVLVGGRRLGLGRPNGPIELRGHLPLDTRRAIYLVQVAERVFVVAVGEAGFVLLGEMQSTELPERAPPTDMPRFDKLLERALSRKKSGKQETAAKAGFP
jgi:flagellar biogenesis protein FliO